MPTEADLLDKDDDALVWPIRALDASTHQCSLPRFLDQASRAM